MSTWRSWAPVGAGLAFLAVCAAIGGGCIVRQGQERVTCEVESISLQTPGLLKGKVVSEVVCLNGTRIPITYRSLDASLTLEGRSVDFEIRKLEPGARIRPGEELRAEVQAELGPLGLVGVGLDFARQGSLEVEIAGDVGVDVWRWPITVPVSKAVTIELDDLIGR